jgi:hypothetical protein
MQRALKPQGAAPTEAIADGERRELQRQLDSIRKLHQQARFSLATMVSGLFWSTSVVMARRYKIVLERVVDFLAPPLAAPAEGSEATEISTSINSGPCPRSCRPRSSRSCLHRAPSGALSFFVHCSYQALNCSSPACALPNLSAIG